MKRRTSLVVALLVILASSVHSHEHSFSQSFHDRNIVIATTEHNFIGCSSGAEILRVLSDWQGRTITKRASSGALALRECIVVEEGELAYMVSPGESLKIGEATVNGYYIDVLGEKQSYGPVWYPRQFLDVVRVEPKEPAKPVEYEPASVPDLVGSLPVGRWSIWSDFKPEWFAKSNDGFGEFEAEWELREDGLGNVLEFHGRNGRPEHGFSFPAASGFVWTHGDEFGWEWREPEDDYTGHLILLTTRADAYALVRATDDLLIMLRSHIVRDTDVALSDPEWQRKEGGRYTRILMVRIGSSIDSALVNFQACVKRNKDRKLYELEECADPFLDADGQRIPGLGVRVSRYH